MTLAFISELPLRMGGGGSFAVTWHVFRELEQRLGARDTPAILQYAGFWPQSLSRVQRKLLRRPGRFAFFSAQRLAENAREIAARLRPADEAVFFKSATPWAGWRKDRPCFVYLDVCFHTFFHNTFAPEDFQPGDLQRIWDAEAQWLELADAVFWESEWGLEMARQAYGVSGRHWTSVGRGGNMQPPENDAWDGKTLELVTIANRFRQKGGDIVLEAFRSLRARFPHMTWRVVGGAPEGDWRSVGGITHEGYLNPDRAGEAGRLRSILEHAFLLLHPTREDCSPLVISEAAYFGCPAVSVRRFAIPELVRDGETGLLLEYPATPESVVAAVSELVENPARYLEMRAAARAHSLARSQWATVGRQIEAAVRRCGVGAAPSRPAMSPAR